MGFNQRYLLQNLIGAGGMGAVYQAIDRLTGETIALKQVPNHLNANSRDAAYTQHDRLILTREFRTLAGLRHPHIVNVLDYGFDLDRQPFFTMELLQNAQTILEIGVDLSRRDQIQLLIQVLQALAYLHRRQIIHRDLKPANILVIEGHEVKLVDFGLATPVYHTDAAISGTIHYVAPEILQGKSISTASDLYSVGVIAYELLLGRYPFNDEQANVLVAQILIAEPDLSDLEAPFVPILSRLLAKSPDERYHDSDEVIRDLCQAIGLPLPTENPIIRQSYLQTAQFVGREAELTQLIEALDRPQGSFWLIGGESGIGKSRLAEELRIQALVRGILVARGQAMETNALPYQTLRQVFRLLTLTGDTNDLDILQEIISDLHELTGKPIAPLGLLDRGVRQQRLLKALVDLLKSQSQPVLMILEDLHWSEESLPLLKSLIAEIASLPVMIVGTYRNDERADLPNELPGAKVISLNRLDQASISTLSESILGRYDERVIDLLMKETEGNAFFIVEVIQALAENSGNLSEIGLRTLPEHLFVGGIQQIIGQRLARISSEALEILKVAAVYGQVIDLEVLTSIYPQHDLETWLTICANAAILARQDEQWQFTHAKIRYHLLSQLDTIEKQHYHRAIAHTLEQLHSNTQVEALAYHWGEVGESEKEAQYLVPAGERASANSAYLRAQRYLERALTLETHLSAINQAKVRLLLGDIRYALGDYVSAKTYLNQSVELTQNANDAAGLARSLNLLGNIALALGDKNEAKLYLEQSLTIGQQNGDLLEVGKSMRSLGVIAKTNGDFSEAKRLFQSSLALLSSVGDQMGVAGSLTNLGEIMKYEGDLHASRSYYEQAIQQFEAINFQWGIAYTLTTLGLTQAKLTDYSAAQQSHERALQICQTIQHRWGAAYSENNLAATLIYHGDLIGAWTHLINALKTAWEIQTIPLVLDMLITLASLHLESDNRTDALPLITLVEQDSRADPETFEMLRDLKQRYQITSQPSEALPDLKAIVEGIIG